MLVSNTEKGGGGKQKQNNKDKFDKIMNSPCENHGFWVNHLAKDCAAYRKRLAEEAAKEATKGDNLNNNRPRWDEGHDRDGFPNIEDTMLIFGGAGQDFLSLTEFLEKY